MRSTSGAGIRSCALLAFVLLSVSLVPAPSAGQAATVLLASATDTTGGWTFPTDAIQRVSLADDPDDAYTGPLGIGAPVPTPLWPAVEIVSVHLAESDAEVLAFRLEVEDLDVQSLMTQHTISGVSVFVTFVLNEHRYFLSGFIQLVCGNPDGGTCQNFDGAVVAFIARLEVADEGQFCCGRPLGLMPSRVLMEENAVEALIPRHLLTGFETDASPRAGDIVSGFQVQTSTSTAIYDRVQDIVPEEFRPEGVNMAMKTNSLGSQVQLRTSAVIEESVAQFTFSGPPVSPRKTSFDVGLTMPVRIPLYVENMMNRKIIVVPTAEIVGGNDQYLLRLPKAIELAAGDTRKFELVVNGTNAVPSDPPLVIQVAVRPLAVPGAVGDRLLVQARGVPQFSVEHPRMYLHATELSPATDVAGQPIGGNIAGFLSTVAQEPSRSEDQIVFTSGCLCSIPRIWSPDAALPASLPLDPEVPGNLHLEIDAPYAGDLFLRMYASIDDVPIGSATFDGTIAAGTSTLDVPILLEAGTTTLPAGGNFIIETRADFAQIPINPFGLSPGGNAPKLLVQGESWLELPLTAAPVRASNADHLLVDLAAGFDDFQYVNPGGQTLWNVTILNQGDANDTVTVDAVAAPSTWTVSVRPAKSFRIGPGESVTVGVLARAPEDAAEEDHVAVNVTAASRLAKGLGSTVTLRGVVTSGIDIANRQYTADNETSSRIAGPEGENTPLGLPIALAAIGAAAYVLRRRR